MKNELQKEPGETGRIAGLIGAAVGGAIGSVVASLQQSWLYGHAAVIMGVVCGLLVARSLSRRLPLSSREVVDLSLGTLFLLVAAGAIIAFAMTRRWNDAIAAMLCGAAALIFLINARTGR